MDILIPLACGIVIGISVAGIAEIVFDSMIANDKALVQHIQPEPFPDGKVEMHADGGGVTSYWLLSPEEFAAKWTAFVQDDQTLTERGDETLEDNASHLKFVTLRDGSRWGQVITPVGLDTGTVPGPSSPMWRRGMTIDQCRDCGAYIGLLGRLFQWMRLGIHQCSRRGV